MSDADSLRQVTPQAAVLRQNNPGPMTLDGTNTWLLRAPSSSDTIVVDPGESDETHVAALLAAAGDIALVLVTHGHFDHSQAAAEVYRHTGAPVRAIDPRHCHGGAPPLADGELIEAAGVRLRVLATPGHTADSASFVVGAADAMLTGAAVLADAAMLTGHAVLTGDTILGRGTSVVAHPDGNLRDYLNSLGRLRDLGDIVVLTGHGPELPRAAEAAQMYLTHREERLAQVRAAADQLGTAVTARRVVEIVYADVDQTLWPAAELSVQAQLSYLRAES
jgi:glyoxylase-like metal-dependent hydrolase (beta-lactamase superfamily II)